MSSPIGHNQKVMNANSLTAEQRKQLKGAIVELNDSLTRVAAERDLQKETVNSISEKLGLDKKLIRRMAKVYFRANYTDEVEENNTFEEFYTLTINAPNKQNDS